MIRFISFLPFLPFLLWLTILVPSVGCSGKGKVDLVRVLSSGRDGWQYPERVIEALEIRRGDQVAEIGAGSGYWLPWLSEAVGPDGRVYLVEVEGDLIVKLEKAVSKGQYTNVEVVLGAYHDPALPDGEIDLALTCLTYHHIDDRVAYFRRLQEDMRPDGRVVHLDDRSDAPAPIRWFQSKGHWSEPDEIRREMKEAGYSRSATFDFLPSQSFQIFETSEAHADAGN